MIKIRKDDDGSRGPDRPRRDDSRPPRKFDKRGGPRNGRPKRDFFGNRPEPTGPQPGDDDFVDKATQVTQHRADDIADLDNQVLDLLEKRAYLIRKEGAWRKSRQKSLVDPKLEKLLRGSFDRKAGELGLDAKLTKQLFTLLNQFSLADIRKKFTGDGYKLAPRVEPVSASIAGPRSFRVTRMMLAMAAAAGKRVHLSPVTMNAPNKDLAKALKQAGAPISWDDREIRNDGGRLLQFEGSMIFVGEDRFNFFLLLCLALGHAGRCKFTGKPGLQLLDLAPPEQGPAEPGRTPGAHEPEQPRPARAAGVRRSHGRVRDPARQRGPGLRRRPGPGRLDLPRRPDHQGADRPARERAAQAVDVLASCGIKAEMGKDSATVSDGVPEIDEYPSLPLSVRLNALLLGLPLMSGGSINIEGTWPGGEQADRVVRELEGLGLRIDAPRKT